MESSPATLKISEKVRKYHFFPRKSMFVSLKNSTLLTIPSRICCSLFVVRYSLFAEHNDLRGPRTANDEQRPLNAQRFAALLAA
jgi:hypothetical protein